MTYPGIAGNVAVDETIGRALEHLTEEDAATFRRKFQQHRGDNRQVMHTFRELVLGAYLGGRGFRVRHERRIGGKTPDWVIVDRNERPCAVVELVNFHSREAVERDIARHRDAGKVWVGRVPDHGQRLYQTIQEKATLYREVVMSLKVPYAVAVHGEFTAMLDVDEVEACVADSGSGLFRAYTYLSGVLFFEERSGHYAFRYFPNPRAALAVGLGDGVF